MTSNEAVAEVLSEIAAYLEMQSVPFKPRAYEKAAEAVSGLGEELHNIYEQGGLKGLEKIPGIGVSIGEKIEELLKTGHLKYYDELKRKTPVELAELRKVEGLGPKSIQKLYTKLGIKNLDGLERAARRGKIATLNGFGKKTEENILKSIEFVRGSGGRFVLGFLVTEIRKIEEKLRGVGGVGKIIVAGSARRGKETIGDIDILATSKKPKAVMDYFVRMPEVVRVHAKGETKSSIKLQSGIDVDLRVVSPESYGAALSYFTGSKDHNVALRELAMKKGLKLNEYGLFRKGKRIAGGTEEGIYAALGLEYIEPEMRENKGEIELSRGKRLPRLIGYKDIEGDLQIQTDWTDGSGSIEVMAREAEKRGLKYIAITDHTKRLAMTHGLDEKRIIKQMAEIDRVNKKLAGKIKILKGTECDILKDGSMDLPDRTLSKLDVVGASVHSHFNLPRKDQVGRIKRAMTNPHVDILFHPTGRIVQKRKAIDLDIDEIIKTAEKTGTILEIDALPERLDLKDDHIRKCVEAGVKMSIDSDAHNPAHLDFLEYGIAQARRGWAERKDIVNAWPLDKMVRFLK